jgi:hypothetical protein
MNTKRSLGTLASIILVAIFSKSMLRHHLSNTSALPTQKTSQIEPAPASDPDHSDSKEIPHPVPQPTPQPPQTNPDNPPTPLPQTPDKGTLVHFLLKNGTLQLSSSSPLAPAGFRQRPIIPRENDLYYRAISTEGALLCEASIPDPSALHHDSVKPDGTFTGGNITIPETSLAIKLPPLPENTTIQIFRISSPLQTPLHLHSQLLLTLEIHHRD